VDDEELIQLTCKSILEHLGYRVLTANNGEEGVEVFKENMAEIDAVLLDLTMPVLDGQGALDEMKKIRPDIKSLFATGCGGPEMEEICKESGAQGFLQKPFSISRVRETMSALFSPPAS
jgi:CheY-like chemotaxis protein